VARARTEHETQDEGGTRRCRGMCSPVSLGELTAEGRVQQRKEEEMRRETDVAGLRLS